MRSHGTFLIPPFFLLDHTFWGQRPSVLNSAPLSRVHNDMETQIHLIEQEAYSSILRAFKAQSDAITWVLILLLLFITNSSNKRLISFDFVHCHSSIVNE